MCGKHSVPTEILQDGGPQTRGIDRAFSCDEFQEQYAFNDQS